MNDEIANRILEHVDVVNVLGNRKEEISIELSETAMRRYGLTFDQVAIAIRKSSINFSSGNIKGENGTLQLSTRNLGDNLEDIAGEKSGIIKKDSITIIGESNNLINNIFINKAKKCNSKIFINDQHENSYSNVLYQEKNISTAIFSIKHLVGFNITEVNILNGIENVELNTGFYGRWSKISDDPKVIIDVAHNISGFEQLAYQIEREDYKKLYIILGFTKGKKVKELIKYLPIDANLFYTSPKIDRGMKKEELLKNTGKTFNFDVNPRSQFLKVKNIASKNDLIIITGSNFLIKDILK